MGIRNKMLVKDAHSDYTFVMKCERCGRSIQTDCCWVECPACGNHAVVADNPIVQAAAWWLSRASIDQLRRLPVNACEIIESGRERAFASVEELRRYDIEPQALRPILGILADDMDRWVDSFMLLVTSDDIAKDSQAWASEFETGRLQGTVFAGQALPGEFEAAKFFEASGLDPMKSVWRDGGALIRSMAAYAANERNLGHFEMLDPFEARHPIIMARPNGNVLEVEVGKSRRSASSAIKRHRAFQNTRRGELIVLLHGEEFSMPWISGFYAGWKARLTAPGK